METFTLCNLVSKPKAVENSLGEKIFTSGTGIWLVFSGSGNDFPLGIFFSSIQRSKGTYNNNGLYYCVLIQKIGDVSGKYFWCFCGVPDVY